MRKLDIQVDILREQQEMDKNEFHLELRRLLEKYFELNSIHIQKKVQVEQPDIRSMEKIGVENQDTQAAEQVGVEHQDTRATEKVETEHQDNQATENRVNVYTDGISQIIDTIETEGKPLVEVFDSTTTPFRQPILKPRGKIEPDYY